MRQIILGMERWNWVGIVSRDGDYVVINNAYNIRRWGTTEGLGEIALKGPRPDTILDFYGTVRIIVFGVVGSVECAEEPWAKWEKNRK
jgi:hypothetical protein